MIRKEHIIFQTIMGIFLGFLLSLMLLDDLSSIITVWVTYTILPSLFGLILGLIAFITELREDKLDRELEKTQ